MAKSNTVWPDSLWKTTAQPLANLEQLSGDIDTDLLIIGAGYTGLSSALHSIDSIKDIVVIDQAQPGWGCSGRNGGQINPQWKPSLPQLRHKFPGHEFGQFIETLDRSAALVYELIETYQIKCQALNNGCMLVGKGDKSQEYFSTWHRFWKDYGADVELLDAKTCETLISTNAYDVGILDRRGGSLQPLSYARGLARACQQQGITLYGDTKALTISPDNTAWKVKTSHGQINCKRLIIATNGYTDDLWPGLVESIIPVASMITATEPLPLDIADSIIPGRQAVAEYSGVPPYYRIDESNRMVFGWRGTVTGQIGSLKTHHLKAKAIKLFPQLRDVNWEYNWAGWVGITSHQRPMLIELGNNAYTGLGYNGRGITMATMMGKQLSLVLNQQNTDLSLKKLKRIPLHRFYPIGVCTRIICGHVNDYLTKSK